MDNNDTQKQPVFFSVLGINGGGKSVIVNVLKQIYGVESISLGAIFRAIDPNSPDGQVIHPIMKQKGGLVPLEYWFKYLAPAIEKRMAKNKNGIAFDAVARTGEQAEYLDQVLAMMGHGISKAYSAVAEPDVVREVADRRGTCLTCGETYIRGIDDKRLGEVCGFEFESGEFCKGVVGKRPDDDPVTVENRIETHERNYPGTRAHYIAQGKLEEIILEPEFTPRNRKLKEDFMKMSCFKEIIKKVADKNKHQPDKKLSEIYPKLAAANYGSKPTKDKDDDVSLHGSDVY